MIQLPFIEIWKGFDILTNLILDAVPFALGIYISKSVGKILFVLVYSFVSCSPVSYGHVSIQIYGTCLRLGRTVFRSGLNISVFRIGSRQAVQDIKKVKMENKRKTVNVAAAVIREGELIFATQRGYGEFKDYWEFPGGKIEKGETPEEALKREIREELDTEIEVGQFIRTVEYDYPSFHLHMDCFFAKVVSGDLILKEHEAAKWLSSEDVGSVNWLPADKDLAELIRRELER